MGFFFFAALVIGWMGTTLLTHLLRPRLKLPGAKPQPTQVPTQDEGDPVAVVFGTARIIPKVSWWGAVQRKPLEQEIEFPVVNGMWGNGPVVKRRVKIGEDQLLGMQMIICMGPIDTLVDIIVDGDKRLSQEATFYSKTTEFPTIFGQTQPRYSFSLDHAPIDSLQDGTGGFHLTMPLSHPGDPDTPHRLYINAPNILGGKNSGGGYIGEMMFYWGGPEQYGNPYLAGVWPNDPAIAPVVASGSFGQPMWRNFCYCVAEDFNFGESPYIQIPEFLVRRLPRKLIETPEGAGLHPNYHNISGRGDANPEIGRAHV